MKTTNSAPRSFKQLDYLARQTGTEDNYSHSVARMEQLKLKLTFVNWAATKQNSENGWEEKCHRMTAHSSRADAAQIKQAPRIHILSKNFQ